MSDVKNPSSQANMWRLLCRKEEQSKLKWTNKWQFLLKELENFNKERSEFKQSTFWKKESKTLPKPDPRSLHPIPKTTNGQYGWVITHPDFKLSYGQDLFIPLPLPQKYQLIK